MQIYLSKILANSTWSRVIDPYRLSDKGVIFQRNSGAASVGEWKRVFGFIKLGNVATSERKNALRNFSAHIRSRAQVN